MPVNTGTSEYLAENRTFTLAATLLKALQSLQMLSLPTILTQPWAVLTKLKHNC